MKTADEIETEINALIIEMNTASNYRDWETEKECEYKIKALEWVLGK